MPAKKVSLLLLSLLLCVSTLPYVEVNASEQHLLLKLSREIDLNSYGYLLLNDTITFVNNSTTSVNLPQFTLLYPTSAIDFQINHPLKKDWVKVSRLGNLTSLTVSAELTIPQSSNLTVVLTAMLGGLVKPLGKDGYEIAIPIPASPDTILQDVVLQLSLPSGVNPQSLPEGFRQRKDVKGDVVYAELNGLQPLSTLTTKLTVNASTYSFTILTVERQDRLVKIISPSEVFIYDTIFIKNEGSGTLYNLKVADEKISSVILVRGEIPLIEQRRISVRGGSIDFYSLMRRDLEGGERTSFTLSYPLTTLSTSDDSLLLKVPLKPLVKDALVKEFHLTVEAPGGYIFKATPLTLNYASSLQNEELKISVRVGAAWSSTYAFPVATLIFITSLIALSAYTSSKRRGEGVHPLLELVKVYEDALRSQEAIADALSTARVERMRASQIDLFTQQLKEIRARTASKASQIKSKIPSELGVEQKLTQFNSLDKLYERTLLDLLSLYKSYVTGKIKREVFEKNVSEKTRSLQNLASSLREALDEMSNI